MPATPKSMSRLVVSDVDQGLNTMCDEITIELVCRVEDGLAGHGATGGRTRH